MQQRTGKVQAMAEFSAWVGTPVAMVVAYIYLAPLAAAGMRIVDMTSDYFAGIVAAVALLAVTYFWPVPQAHRKALMILWLVRTGTTLGLMLAYEARYGLDAAVYFATGKALNQPLSQFDFGEGSINVTAIVGLLTGVTESYNAMKVMFAYLGLAATYIFYRAAVICLGGERIALLYLLGLFPSFLFWTSILGKDPIVCFGIAVYCYGVAGLLIRQKMSMLFFVAAGLLIASFIRIWLGVVFITPLIAVYVLAGRISIVTKGVFVILAVPAFLFSATAFSDRFNVETSADLVRTTDTISSAWAHGGSGQAIDGGFSSIQSMIAFAPVGTFAALFRPLPFEVPNIFGALAGAENLAILLLFIYGFARQGVQWLRQPILLWAAMALVVWGAIYGFASYQNLGTAFRFRAQIAPILLLLGLYLAVAPPIRRRKGAPAAQRPGPPAVTAGEQPAR